MQRIFEYWHVTLIGTLLFGACNPMRGADYPLGLKIPPGFEVTEYCDSRLANDIFSMTLDPQGRIVVSGRGYIRLLLEDNISGKANRAIDLGSGPKEGAQGLLWEGSWLYFMADGGLHRYRIHPAGDRTEGPPELIRVMKTGGEHCAHAIRRGPDRWLYVLCGNTTGIDKSFAQHPGSPIENPIAGCVLRFPPDLRTSEIVADGFRNPYDMDFNVDGDLFTFESDNERCVSLPWYESTRFYQVIPGGHYGWLAPQRAETWRLPPYFFDVISPIAYLGRGSPTGVACYRHAQFPEKYQGGMFLCDWTFGRVYFLSLQKSGTTYTARSELFLESVGDNGFAPTAITVHPKTGDLYISIGGRGTRGAVYRIRFPSRAGSIESATLAKLQLSPRSLEWREESETELVANACSNDAFTRRRALHDILHHPLHFPSNILRKVIAANWNQPDALLRNATAQLIARLDQSQQRDLRQEAKTEWELATWCLGSCRHDPDRVIPVACKLLHSSQTGPGIRENCVRAIQIALGDISHPKQKGTVWEGYSLRGELQQFSQTQEVVDSLQKSFPSGHPDLDREISRTLAMLADAHHGTLAKVLDQISTSSDPVEDIHYLIVSARLMAQRTTQDTTRVAAGLLALDNKLSQRKVNRDRNWPLRIAELHAELAGRDPNLNNCILSNSEFGRPDHALFARCPGFNKPAAAKLFLVRIKETDDYPWTAGVIKLMGSLPDEQCVPVLRELWGKAGLDESILPILARRPQLVDLDKFIESLNSPKLATIRMALEAMEKLPVAENASQALALVRCLRSLPEEREEKRLQERIVHYLQRISGQEKLGVDKQAWTDWFTKKFPDQAARLANADGVDVTGWNQRLNKLDWSGGEAERGKAVYIKTNCSSCHSGAQALGPDLRGVANRFSRDDLFTAILEPSKDISLRYRTTLIGTQNGRIYQGLVVYEAVDGVILQTGPAATVRIPGDQIATRRTTSTSLMPTGLLENLTDREIVDLYAYLKSLR
jgi:putative heme-binding domain-containing protein